MPQNQSSLASNFGYVHFGDNHFQGYVRSANTSDVRGLCTLNVEMIVTDAASRAFNVERNDLADCYVNIQVLVDNGFMVRDPTGWEIFRHREGGYGVSHDERQIPTISWSGCTPDSFRNAFDAYAQRVLEDRRLAVEPA